MILIGTIFVGAFSQTVNPLAQPACERLFTPKLSFGARRNPKDGGGPACLPRRILSGPRDVGVCRLLCEVARHLNKTSFFVREKSPTCNR